MRTTHAGIHPSFGLPDAISSARHGSGRAPGANRWGFSDMALDVKTLFYLTIYVDAILGVLLLFVWSQSGGSKALAWWGSAHLMRAVSVILFGLYGTVSDLISIDLANAILLSSYAVTWNG